jgi:hypothetical protein
MDPRVMPWAYASPGFKARLKVCAVKKISKPHNKELGAVLPALLLRLARHKERHILKCMNRYSSVPNSPYL